jgi:hypothetical protein
MSSATPARTALPRRITSGRRFRRPNTTGLICLGTVLGTVLGTASPGGPRLSRLLDGCSLQKHHRKPAGSQLCAVS